MRRVLTFCIFLLNITFSFGQLDNEFWFVVPKITKDHNPGDAKRSYFVFTNSNDTDAYVTISMPMEGAWQDTTIRVLKHSSYKWQVNSRLSILFNTYILTDPNPYGRAGKNVKGVHIISRLDVLKPNSRIDITIYYEYGNTNNPDIFTLKGRNALGTEFYTSFQTDCYNVGLNWAEPAYSAFDIVFTENNTFIDLVIPPGKAIVNGFNGVGAPYTPLTGTVLNIGPFNAGETFSCIPAKTVIGPEKTGYYASDKYFGRAAVDHLAGVQIKTRNGKKVAVTLKDDSMKALWSGCYDLNGDQTVPVNVTGNDYIAMRGQLNTGFPDNGWYNRPPTAHQWYNPPPNVDKVQDQERLYIMATDNNTRIQIDGTTVATINAGEQYIYPIPSAKDFTYVKSLDSSIYVYQITGFGCEEGGAVLPSISTCTGSTNVGFSRTVGGTGNGFFQNILVRKSAKPYFRINGKINAYLNAAWFTDVPGTNWAVARRGFTNNPPDSVGNYLFPAGSISTISNDSDVFHLGIINGGASSGTRYGYFSNYNAVKPQAYISESGTGDMRICFGQGVQIYARGGVFYSWVPGLYLSDPYSDHPIATPPYTINYVATVRGYCNVMASTNVNVDVAPPLKASYSLDKTFGCAPLKVQFHDKSEGASRIRYWCENLTTIDRTWNFITPGPPPKAYDKPNNDSTFYHTYTNTANPDTYKVYHTMVAIRNNEGCVDTFKRDLIVFPTVTTSITTPSATATSCDSFPVSFIDSTRNAHYYYWEFGDAGSSDLKNPSHVFRNYTAVDDTFQTRLIATSKYFCKDTDYRTIIIHPQLEANFAMDTARGCANLPIHITNQSAGKITLYKWNFGNGTDSTIIKKNYDRLYLNDTNYNLNYNVNLTVSNSGGLCKKSMSRNILVYPHVDPKFIVDDSINCNPLLARFTPDSNKVHVQWTWTFGDGSSSGLQKPSHLFENFTNNDDTFRTKLIVLSDNMCKDSLTKNIIVRGRIEAAFTVSPAAGCGGFTTTFHNASSGGIKNYNWDFGEGTIKNWPDSIQPDTFPKTFDNFTNFTKTDTVKLVVDNGYCTAPYTAYITVYPSILDSFIYDKVMGCTPFTTHFTNKSNKITADLFKWDFGDGVSSFNSDTVSHQYDNITSFNKYDTAKLTATSSSTGCSKTFSVPVVVYKFIKADFKINDAHLCSYQLDSIKDNSRGGINTWYWDYKGIYYKGNPKLDSTSGNKPLQVKYYNNTADSVIKNLKLYVRNDKFCYDSLIRPIVVYRHITSSFTIPPANYCDSQVVNFDNNSPNPAALYHNWDFGDGTSSTLKSPSHTYFHLYPNVKNYTVKLTEISKFQCDTTSVRNIAVQAFIKADFKIGDAHVCSFQSDSIFDNSIGGINKWYWDYKGNWKLDSASGKFPPPVKYDNETADSVTKKLKLYVRNNKFCYDSLTRPIVVYRRVLSSFNFSPPIPCDSAEVRFTNNGINPAAFYHNWDFGDGASSTLKETTHTYFHLFPNINTYNVKLTETSKYQCDTTSTKTIQVNAYIKADFSMNKYTICPGDSIQFVNNFPAVNHNKWDFDGTTLTNNNKTFWQIIPNPDTVERPIQVKLIVFTPNGNCTDTLTRLVILHPRVIANFGASHYVDCNPFNVQFSNSSSTSAIYYTWTFGDGSSSSAKNPLHLFENSYSYNRNFPVNLHVESEYNCTNDFPRTITVYPFIQADFKVKKADVCSDSSIFITDNTPAGVRSRMWDFDGNGTIDATYAVKKDFSHPYSNPSSSPVVYNLTLIVKNSYPCYDTVSTPVTIYPRIIANFDYARLNGCNPSSVDFTNHAISAKYFNWDFGDGNTSNLPSPLHVYTNTSVNDTTFHATLRVQSQYLCQSDTTQDIPVYSYIDADFKVSEASICSGVKTLVVDTSLFVKNITNRKWDFDANFGFIDTLNEYPRIYLHPTNTSDEVKTIPLKLTVKNNHDCPSTISRDITIYPEVRAQFTMDSVVCSPFPVQFFNHTNTAATDFNWSFGEGSTSSLKDPVKNYINYTDLDTFYNVQLLSISNYLCKDSITKTLYLNHKPRADFYVDSTIACPPFNLVLHNKSITSNAEFDWNFRDNTNDTVTHNYNDFIHTFNNSSGSFKTYQVELKAITNKNCRDSMSLPIQVYPQVTAGFNTIASGCTPFTDTLDNTSSPSASYFYWDFDDSEFSNQKSPLHEFFNNGTTNITFSIMLRAMSAYGCKDSIYHDLVVYPAPNADFLTDKVFDYYPDATFNFYDLTNKGPWTYDWDFGDGTEQSNVNDTVTYTYQHWGNFKVILHVANGQCSDIAEQDIMLLAPVPIAKFDSSAAGCSPVTVFFNSDSTKWANTYRWQFDDGTTSDKKNPSHTFNKPGDFNVILTVIGDGGTAFDQKMIRVYQNPIAQFSIRPTQVMIPNATVRCFNSTPGDFNQYNWYFGDGGESSSSDPVYKYSKVGTYTIKLVVTSENNCLDSTTDAITVGATGKIKFPNAFMPDMNGPSGGKYNKTDVNIFYPNYDGVAEYHLEIYNRWGELIFISDDVTTGWDGYYKGKLCPQGVYVYKYKVKFYDGRPDTNAGDVTLLLKKGIK